MHSREVDHQSRTELIFIIVIIIIIIIMCESLCRASVDNATGFVESTSGHRGTQASVGLSDSLFSAAH